MLAARDVVPPIFFVDDDVVGTFPTLDQALRSVDPADLPGAPAYDAEGRQLVLKDEGGQTVLDEWASGDPGPEELRARLVAHAHDPSLPPRPSAMTYVVLVAVLLLGLAVVIFVL